MHDPGDFSSLKCDDFNTDLTVDDNKTKNKKLNKIIIIINYLKILSHDINSSFLNVRLDF